MEMGIQQCADAQTEVAAANYPEIRLRYVNKTHAPVPLDRLNGSAWMVCTPTNIGNGTWGGFSASAYYFGRELHTQLKVPVGLIQSAWGGTIIEPWTTPEGFRMVPKLKDLSEWTDKANGEYRGAITNYLDIISAWDKSARKALAENGPLPPPPPVIDCAVKNQEQPTALYNAMIAPWVPYAIRGAVWYQGESNNIKHDGMLYYEKMKALIGGWRKAFGEDNLCFYFVQIAPYRYGNCKPTDLAELWAAQLEAAKLPGAGMAHTQDIGDVKDIHPKNKQDVGRRLARLALSRTYAQKFVDDCGPQFKSMYVDGSAIRVKFDYAVSGLASRDGKPLTCFEIAGADNKFVPAEVALSSSDEVAVRSAQVSSPVQVRFGWSDTAEPNLMNREKLPAATFFAPAK